MVWEEKAAANITDYYGMLQYISASSGEYFGLGMIMATFIISLISFRKIDMEGVAISSFIAFIVASAAKLLNLTSDMVVATLGVITIVSVIIIYVQKRLGF